jgi:phage baseplate assembly protein W
MATSSDFLGHGLQYPFQRDGKQAFAAAGGTDHIDAKIAFVLGTNIGELPWLTDFGSNLDSLRHLDNNLDITAIARQYTIDALERWLPDIAVTEFSIERVKDASGAETKLRILLGYSLRSLQGNNSAPSLEAQIVI